MKTSRLYQPATVTHARRLSLILSALTRTARYVTGAHRLRHLVALSLVAALTLCLLPNRWSVMPTAQAQISVRGCGPSSGYIIQNCALSGGQLDKLFYEAQLENEAINDLLTAHQLPSADRGRLMGWQRNEIRAAMFDKLLAYIKKDLATRSASEQALVDGLTNLVKQRRVLAATKALEEYNRWANSPCTYIAPAGFRYNIPTTCASPGGGLFGGPRPPSFEEFKNYGVSSAYADFQNKPELQAIAGDTARALGLLGGFAAAGVAGIVGGAIGASLTAGSAIITAIQPFVAASIGAQTATGVIGAVSIGAAAAIVILAVVLGIFQGINVFEDAQIPGKLQEAKNNAENTTPDLAQLVTTDAGLREVFAEFLQATMPDFPATTGVPAQQDSDPKFLLTPGGSVDPLLKYRDWLGVNHTARLNGGWFVDQAAGGQERLTLSIDYVDAAGVKWTASRVGGEFLHTRTDAPDASFKSAEITYQDWSGAILTARIHNAAPSIAAVTVTRKQGPPAADGLFGNNPNISQVATVSDAEDAEDALTVDVVSFNPNNGVTVSDLKVDAAGKVTAKVQPSCSASNTGFLLRVTDSTGQSAYAIFSVTIIPNNAPVLSYPSAAQRVAAGGALTVKPTAGPSDEGIGISILVGGPSLGDATVSPAGFTGTIQVTKIPPFFGSGPSAGEVTISNAGPSGTYTVTVPLTGDCNGTTNATFTLVVTPTDTDGDGVPDSRDNCPTTPNPERIAFRSARDGGNPEIYVMNAGGTNPIRLTNNTAFDAEPALSPDGSHIAFVSNRDGNTEIYVMNADGTNQTRLTNNPADDTNPAFSANGSKIAFVSDRDGNAEIYVMNADGTNPIRLTTNPAGDAQPVFSPDGSKIAFVSSRDGGGSGIFGNPEIYIMNANGSNPTRLTNNPSFDLDPAFSPDGSKIAFTSIRDGNGEIYVMNANGTNQTNLTNNPAVDGDPAFSPDGSRIAFFSNRAAGNNDIYVMDADGTNPVRLTDNPAFDLEPSFIAQADTDRDGRGDACDNAAPTATGGSVTRQQGAPASISTIATVGDDQTPAGNLVVTLTSVPAGITVTDLTNSGGNVTARVAATYSATPGANTVGLKVTDAAGLSSTASLIVNVTRDQQPPSITCPVAQSLVTNNGSVAVNYPTPTANDNLPGATVACLPPAGASFPLGTTTVNCTATDAANNKATCSFTVTVRQVRPAIKNLIAQVRTLAPSPLTAGQVNALLGHLEMANTRLERGQTAPACTHLHSFINQVNGFINGRPLTTAQGQPLLDEANKIRSAMGCASP